MKEVVLALKNCKLFSGLCFEEISRLICSIDYKILEYKSGDVIFSYEKSADKLGIILSGYICVQKILPSGKVVAISSRSAPDLIADASVFSNTVTYPSIILSQKTSRVMILKKEELLKLFSSDNRVMSNFLECVSNRVLDLNRKIEILSLSTIKGKIAFYLLDRAEKSNSSRIVLPYSKKSWAEHLNVSRTALSRELCALKVSGILSFQRNCIEILSAEKLSRFLS